jgi:hypothetical protein
MAFNQENIQPLRSRVYRCQAGRASAYDDEIVESTIIDIVVKSEAIRQP